MLELFSGTGSVGRAFDTHGWEVTSLDVDPKARPTIVADVMTWDYKAFEPSHFDFIWCSPPCVEYSVALRTRPRNLEAADAVVLRTLEIIEYLRPRWWAMENPATGLLKTRAFMAGLPFHDICYCMSGFRYRKKTRVWGTLPWEPSKPMCTKRTPCPHLQDGKHPEAAQRVPNSTHKVSHSRDQLYSLPPALCDEIADAATAAMQ